MRACAGDGCCQAASSAVRQPSLSVSDGSGRQDPHRQHPARHEGRGVSMSPWPPRRRADLVPFRSGPRRCLRPFRLLAGASAVPHQPSASPWRVAFRSPSPPTDRLPAAACIGNALAGKPDVVVVDFPHADVLMPERIDTGLRAVHPQCRGRDLRAPRRSAPEPLAAGLGAAKPQDAAIRAAGPARYDTVIAVSQPRRGCPGATLRAADGGGDRHRRRPAISSP